MGGNMRVLGLDLSLTATGWATGLDRYGVYKPATRGVGRLVELNQWLTDLVWNLGADPDGELAVIEGYAYAKTNQAHQIGEWGGVARLTLYQAGIPYVEVPPAVLKKFSAGRGNATKADMRMALYQRTGIDVKDDNTVDAIWLAAAGHQAAENPLWDMPKTNVAALEKIQWPPHDHPGRTAT